MRVWKRRFKGRENIPLLEAFNASISQDRFLYEAEIEASLVYARALFKASVISGEELNKIEAGLERVKNRIEGGEALDRFEDIHSAVELLLIEEIGEAGQKLHTGRSRNEQVVTAEKLYLKKKIPLMLKLLRKIQVSLIQHTEQYEHTLMAGYTHLRQAQYVLFSHYLMSLFWPLERAKSRLIDALKRMDKLPLGVGALAGSTVPIDREYMRELLGFASVTENSMDTVSDRSFILEILFVLSLLLLDISRFAEDFIIFSTEEFGYFELDSSLQTSSSLMPQKKNPDILELIRASCARLFGYLTTIFIAAKGLPSTYNKDLQEDKVPLHQGIEETLRVLEVFHHALSKIKPKKEKMTGQASSFLLATDLVDYLVSKGVPFREAHGIVSEIVNYAEREEKSLETLKLEEYCQFCNVFEADVHRVFNPLNSIENKKTAGSTHPEHVKAQIERAKKLLSLSPGSGKRKIDF